MGDVPLCSPPAREIRATCTWPLMNRTTDVLHARSRSHHASEPISRLEASMWRINFSFPSVWAGLSRLPISALRGQSECCHWSVARTVPQSYLGVRSLNRANTAGYPGSVGASTWFPVIAGHRLPRRVQYVLSSSTSIVRPIPIYRTSFLMTENISL